MAIQNINDVLIANEIKAKIKNNSASSLPLNPSAQGWSATKIREKLYRAVCSESGDLDDNLLDVLATRLSTIKGILEILDANILLKADQTSLELLFSQLEDGIITVDKANKDGDGLVIKSNYGVSLVLSYDNATNTLTSRLYASDGSLLDTHSAILTKSSSVADGLQSKEHFAKLEALPTNANLTNSLAGKVPSTRKILGIDLVDDILLAEFKTAIGEATAILSGLMSATDKARLDALHALLGVESDADVVVNTINEVLAIFSAYPEGADLVNALSGKVDKVAGKGLSANDFTDILKAKLDSLLSGNNYYDKTYIDALKDLNGWSSALLTETALTNGGTITKATLSDYDVIKLFVIKTATGEIDTDSFDTSIGLVDNYKYVFFDNDDIYLSIADPNCTFTDNITGYQLKIIGQKYVAQDAENVNYDKTVKNLLDAENVQDAIDELADEVLAPAFVEVEHLDLRSEITATDNIEIKDDSGELVKITGNLIDGIIRDVDLGSAISGTSNWVTLSKNQFNLGTSKTNFAIQLDSTHTYWTFIKWKSFDESKTTFNMSAQDSAGALIQNVAIKPVNLITSVFWKPTTNRTFNAWFYFLNSQNISSTEIDYHIMIDLEELKSSTILSDDGVMLKDLSEAEVKEQLTIWGQQGFPTKINKLISKSDNLFNGKFNALTSLASENLIANSDLLLDSNSDGVPDGFTCNFGNKSLLNGILTLQATDNLQLLYPSDHATLFNANDYYYTYARVKTSSNTIDLANDTDIISNNEWVFVSTIIKISTTSSIVRIIDRASSDFQPIEIDYIGAINITDLVSRGILPSGLTNAQYKEMLDNAIYNNVPLRESDFISVEPSVAYRLIKASENSAIHKVIEYTADNQIVKVNSVDYSGNVKISAPITMNALTSKVKLISDLMDRPSVKITNRFFTSTSNWSCSHATGSVASGIYTAIGNDTSDWFNVRQDLGLVLTHIYYVSGEVMTPDSDATSIRVVFDEAYSQRINSPSANTWYRISYLKTGSASTVGKFEAMLYHATSANGKTLKFRNPLCYNITDFKNKGVADDNGTLFSRLTNDEIKDQMDIWTEVGFPDHVINALYPDGADTAISLKYNDGNAIYYPQVIDELPLDITLRADEYWQDGYIVKQNGNAEASPLGKVFSAWNYGQIEAIYDSGIPADFKVRYAQNTSAQVSTHSDYLIEARERLDTLRRNQELLIEKLGVDVEADDYDSFVGITSAEYEYFALEGIKEGDKLNIDAYGQGVLNLLPNTITTTQTAVGLTITYDDTTGIVTVNGTSTGANNFILKTGMVLGKPQGTTVQLMRYFVSGTANLNGSYIGYILAGTSVSNRINENSESLYDPYINASGGLKASGALSGVAGTSGQTIIFQVFASGMVFTDFKFKLGVFEGLTLQPFVMPSVSNSSAVDVYNHTANKLNTAYTTTPSAVSGITVTYDPLSQEYIFDGTASGANSITLSTNLFSVKSGDRLSIKRLYQSGAIAPVSALPIITLISGSTTIVSNSIYKMTAPEGQTPTPDVTFNTGTASADLTNVTLKLSFASGDVFTSYRCRIMIHDKSSDIGYAPYSSTKIGSISLEAGARGELSFTAIEFGILSFVPQTDKLNVVFGTSLTDLSKTNLEYNAGIQSPNRRISELNERLSNVDNVFRDKVIAIWGDSRESNNPTSDPQGVGDQLDTSYPAILAKKLGATVLNFGLSGGCWAENTVQQDASSAIVNRVQTQDTTASADIILISSMNDFKLATPLGSPLPNNKTASTFYGAMRLTYERLATKYPAKKIWLVLPQKRYDESTNYGGGSYLAYRKAQIEVAREYGIQTIDLYNNFANGGGGNTAPTFPTTTMLNATHFTAIGNDIVAELIARALLGNGNSGSVDVIPPLPTTAGTYTLKVVISAQGIPTFSWTVDE